MRIKTKINKDLDLRRFGKNVYSKAMNEGGNSGSDDEGGGGNTPSGDITIDDVVKFIHDESGGEFLYTTWNDIPNIDDVGIGELCKGYNVELGFSIIILGVPPYTIGLKGGESPIDPIQPIS